MATPTVSAVKYVYSFGGGKAEGNGKMKDILGGKGAGLAEMTNAGLPVPPGFTIQTEACREYMRGKRQRRRGQGRWTTPCAQLEAAAGPEARRAATIRLLVSRALRREVLHARHDGHHPQPRPQR